MGVMALSALAGLAASGVVGATSASATTSGPAACTATSTATCTLTLKMASGTWTVHNLNHTAPTAFPATAAAGFSATENPTSGALSAGTLTFPVTHESNRGSTETIIFRLVPGTEAAGQVTSSGLVTITAQLQAIVHITVPLNLACTSTPITVKLASSSPYDASTGDVTVTDSTFTIPQFTANYTYTGLKCGAALGTINKTFSGATGNKFALNLHGTLVVPPSPTRTSVTTLTASSAAGIVGQTTTLTATVSPSSASGHVTFFTSTKSIATVPVSSGIAQYKTKALPVGSDHLKATYSGNGTFKPSTGMLTYLVKTAPGFSVNYPSVVVAGAAPTMFGGGVSDPVGGPTLANVRLDFTLYATKYLTALSSTQVSLLVCTTAAYAACTANILTGKITTPRTHITGVYGGVGGNSGFSLTPGTQIPLYFKLSEASGSGIAPLTITTDLVQVTGSGSKVLATFESTKSVVDLTRTSRTATTIRAVVTGAGGDHTYQGYGVDFRVTITHAERGPTPTGTITIYRTSMITGHLVQTALGAYPVTRLMDGVGVEVNTETWPLGTSKITDVYSGDTYYLPPSTPPSVTFTITPAPSGTKYTCGYTLEFLTSHFTAHGIGLIVTGINTVTLPASALAGSTVHTTFTVTMDIDATTPMSEVAEEPTSESVNFTLSPTGLATTSLPTGGTPMKVNDGVAFDSTTHTLYVASAESSVVGVITADTQKVERTIPVGSTPRSVVFDPDNNLIYVISNGSSSVSMITTTKNVIVGTITLPGAPVSEAFDGVTNKLYVAIPKSTTLVVVTTATNTIGLPIKVRKGARDITVAATTNTIYAVFNTGSTTGTLYVVTGNTVVKILSGTSTTKGLENATGVAVDPVTHKIYVSGSSPTKVTIITGNSYTHTSSMHVRTASNIAVDVTTDTVYVQSTDSSLILITGSTHTTKTLSLSVKGFSIDPASDTVYVGGNFTVSIVTGGQTPVASTISTVGSKGNFTGLHALTASASYAVGGTLTLPTSAGVTPVSLPKLQIQIPGLLSITITCVPISDSAIIGTIDVLPKAKPTVTTQPTSQAANAGTAATFTAAASGEPAPSVQWQSSTNGATWVNITGATATSYTTPATTAAENGTDYRAVFTNTSGTVATTAATLTVDVAPTVTTQPSSAAVTAGTPVSFTAGATARPAASVQWQVSSDGGKTFTNVAGATSTTLTFAPTKTQGTDQYRAVFTNTLGSATTNAATLTVTTTGYRLFGSDGAVYDFGTAPFYGSMGGQPLNAPVVGAADTPTNKGYWEVASDGGIFAFGTAGFYGSMGGQPLNQPVVGMAATPTGKGYWEVAKDGGIFAFGSAQFYGSMGGKPLNQPIVGMAATPTGKGYWLVASDGGVFAFGSAQFFGSTGSMTLAQPITAMAPTPTGKGYWLVAKDGGVFAFGAAPFEGSAAGGTAGPYLSMAAAPTGHGYWLAGAFGAVTAFGTAPLAGSMAGQVLNAPVVAVTAG